MRCIGCGAKGDGFAEVDGAPFADAGLCPECVARSLLSPKERKALEVQGRRAARAAEKANLGMPTEERVAESCARMAADGVAWLWKEATPYKVIGRAGKVGLRVVTAEKSRVDFHGWDADGRALAVEVKSVSGSMGDRPPPRFYLRNIPDHQRRHLDLLEAAGGRAYLLVDFPGVGRWFLVPWCVASGWTRVAPEDGQTVAFEADRERFLVMVNPARGEWPIEAGSHRDDLGTGNQGGHPGTREPDPGVDGIEKGEAA